LIVVDPITEYLGNTDGNNTLALRSILAPVVKLAEEYNVAIIMISHLNKNIAVKALHRTMGSVGFVAIARAVWCVAYDRSDEKNQRRFFMPLKTNLSIHPTSLAFRIQEGVVVFEPDPVDISADEILTPESGKSQGVFMETVWWINNFLDNGPVSSSEIFKEGKKMGFSIATLKRAKSFADISARKIGFGENGKWCWGKNDLFPL